MVEGAQRAFGARPFGDKIACAFGRVLCGGVAEWLKAHSAPLARVPSGTKNCVRLRARALRRGGRVVEGARLESVYTGNRIAGSNPAPSAIFNSKEIVGALRPMRRTVSMRVPGMIVAEKVEQPPRAE